MSKDQVYQSISKLKDAIVASLEELEQGQLSLTQLEELLANIRELEERVVVIRYRGYEKVNKSEEKRIAKVQEKEEEYSAPELPLEETEDDKRINQISLIDSIEEISKEDSINERMSDKTKPTLAQVLERKPVKSISSSLNLNQKLGMAKEFFKGDEAGFKKLLKELDKCSDSDMAIALTKERMNGIWDEEHELIIVLVDLIERRFL